MENKDKDRRKKNPKEKKQIGQKNNPKDKGKDGQWSQGIGASQPPETGPRGERNSTGLQNVNFEVSNTMKLRQGK